MKLTELIEQTFNTEGSLYLACNVKQPFFGLSRGHVKKFVTLSIIVCTINLSDLSLNCSEEL